MDSNHSVEEREGYVEDPAPVCECGWSGKKTELISLVSESQIKSAIAGESQASLVCPRCGMDEYLYWGEPKMPKIEAQDRLFHIRACFFDKIGNRATTWRCGIERDEKPADSKMEPEYNRLAELDQSLERKIIISTLSSPDGVSDDQFHAICYQREQVAKKLLDLKWQIGGLIARARAFTCQELGLVIPFLRERGYFGFQISVQFGSFKGYPNLRKLTTWHSTVHSADFEVPSVGNISVFAYDDERQSAPGEYSDDESDGQLFGATCRGSDCGWIGDPYEPLRVLRNGRAWHEPGAVLIYCPDCEEPSVELFGDSGKEPE